MIQWMMNYKAFWYFNSDTENKIEVMGLGHVNSVLYSRADFRFA